MADSGSAQAYRGSLDKLVGKVNEARGIDLGQYRRAYLERRLSARLRVLNLHSYRQYADLLDEDPEEYTRLIDTLTINVTEFFRDKVVWDSIRKNVLRPMIQDKLRGRSKTIRVWSAACATGEEAYSIAMMLLDVLGDDRHRFLISVIGTDLDPRALSVAEAGVYEVDGLKRVPSSYKLRFTEMTDSGSLRMKPEVRRIVRFSHMSLFDDAPLRVVDLILCRNVFIYFDREQQARVLGMFYRALARGGYLVLGRSEKLSDEAALLLEPIDGRERIYRKPLRP